MKLRIQIIIILIFILIFSACDKTPSAFFKTDKPEYVAGETVKLLNESNKGYSYKWTMPDGQQINTNDANYLIPADFGFGRLDFKLEAFSKHHRKMNSKTISIEVVPRSFFFYFYPNGTHSDYFFNHIHNIGYDNLYHYTSIGLYNDNQKSSPCTQESINFYFPNNQIPVVGNYVVNASNYNLPSGQVSMVFFSGPCELPFTLNSTAGNVRVDYINGKLHLLFDSIVTQTAGIKMSGEIFLPSNL